MGSVGQIDFTGTSSVLDGQTFKATIDDLQASIEGLARAAVARSANPRVNQKVKDARRLITAVKRHCESFASADKELLRLGAIVSCSEDAILSKNLKGIIQTWNEGATRLFGYEREEMVGQSIRRLIPPDRMKEEEAILRRLRQGKRVEHYETVRRRKDGTLLHVSISISPIRDADDRVIGAAKIIRDITDQRQADVAVRESVQRMRAIVETAVDAIITIDERGTIESVNPSTVRLFGYSAADMLGNNVSMLMPEPYQSEHDGYLHSYLRTGHARIIGIGRDVVAMRKDGTTFPINLAVSEVALEGRRLFTGIVHDLSNRRQLERQLLEASTSEQRRIGQDLHDGLCQDLIGIAFGVDTAARQFQGLGKVDAEPLHRIAASIREAAGEARRLSHGLNPIDLKAGGLPVALEAMAKKIADSFGITCTFKGTDDVPPLDDATSTHLYRIAQEAIGNAIKHGRAAHVQVCFEQVQKRLTLTVSDDGIGMPEKFLNTLNRPHTDYMGASPSGGIGLQGMQYRSNLIGAILEVTRRHPRGTVIRCIAPINNNSKAMDQMGRLKTTSATKHGLRNHQPPRKH